jgi:hypothetical protein
MRTVAITVFTRQYLVCEQLYEAFAWGIDSKHQRLLFHLRICPKRHPVHEQLLDTLTAAPYALCDIHNIVRNTHKTSL